MKFDSTGKTDLWIVRGEMIVEVVGGRWSCPRWMYKSERRMTELCWMPKYKILVFIIALQTKRIPVYGPILILALLKLHWLKYQDSCVTDCLKFLSLSFLISKMRELVQISSSQAIFWWIVCNRCQHAQHIPTDVLRIMNNFIALAFPVI